MIILDSLGGTLDDEQHNVTREEIAASWRDLREERDAIVVDNNHGRTAEVELLVPGYTGKVQLDRSDERFMCSRCERNINPPKYFRSGPAICVDSNSKVWCTSCWSKYLDWTVRSVDKHRDETRPRHIHPGGNYYQLLKEPEGPCT